MKIPQFINLFLAICLATSVSAEQVEIPRPKKPDPRAALRAELLAKYDKDKDGKLSESEIKTIARDRMLRNDDNKDGKVDQVELKRERSNVRKMPKMDALERAMAREKALMAEKNRKEKEKSKAAEKAADQKSKQKD